MWCIGDVHGNIKTLEALLAQLPSDEPKVFTGDLIDRGPNSYAVVELAIKNNIKSVLGNHELLALASLFGGKFKCGWDDHYIWMRNGGAITNQSYRRGTVSKRHLAWMASLPTYLEFPELKDASGRHLFVSHSCVHKDIADNLNGYSIWDEYYSILWNRRAVHPSTTRYYVHGHTPCEVVVGKDSTNIDSGCVFNGAERRDGGKFVGMLTAIRWPDLKIVQQVNLDSI